jgi:DNA polymerase I-like protein with 3'-5' exonuclease and polymerase domains
MSKVALVDSKPGRNYYSSLFDNAFEFDEFHLVDNPDIKKVLKKDVTLDIDVTQYDWVILVGSEPLKYYTGVTSVTEYSGRVVDDKFLPVINPAMLAFKPEAKKLWNDSKDRIIQFISGEVEKTVISDNDFIGITEEEDAISYLQAAIDAPESFVALDTETTNLYPRDGYILGFSLSYEDDKGAYISTDCMTEEVVKLWQELFNKKKVVFWNAKFDIAFLEYHFDFKFPDFEDAMLVHYMLDETPGTHGLKQNTLKYLKYGDYEKPMYDWIDEFRKRTGILKGDFSFEYIPFEIIKTYAALDAACTFLLYKKFWGALKKNSRLISVYKDILLPATRFLIDIQDNGVPFNKERLFVCQEKMLDEITEAVKELSSFEAVKEFEQAQGKPFNPNSVVQLRRLLFDFLNLQPTGKMTAKGENSTDSEVLHKLASQHEVPNLILTVRKKSKIKNTYLDKIIPQLNRDNRLRTNFNIHMTTSGRLSSSGKLNMQQIPREDMTVKGCIQAANRLIHSNDLTTAEVYVAAVLSEDYALQKVFIDGGNFHSTIAKLVFNLPCEVDEVDILYPLQRQAAKAVTFGIMYGAGPHKISEQVTNDGGSLSVSQARQVINDYFKSFPDLEAWIEQSKEDMKRNGYAYSFFGRKRRLPNLKSDNKGIVGHELRSGLNFLVQSVASDINLLGAIDAHNEVRARNLDANIFALVHDSIVADVHPDVIDIYEEIVVRNMQKDRGIMIPGCPIGCDHEYGTDYSFGKFKKQYAAAA